jgi:NAD(P)-dependent dehydrogenase (short-subunit alcohol dehydrogenase family)
LSARELTTEHFHTVDGSVTAVTQLLDGMRSLGHGTILFVNGGSAARSTRDRRPRGSRRRPGARAGLRRDTCRPSRGRRRSGRDRARGLHAAFNNAGIQQPLAALAAITDEQFDQIVAVDLRGVFLCVKHELRVMLERGGGAIVNTSSGAGLMGFRGQAAYAAPSTPSSD